MNRRIIPALIVLALLAVSCQWADRVLKGDVVARVGQEVLYRSDLELIVPKNVKPEDSLALAEAYIQQWALRCLLLEQADSQLSDTEKDLSREIDEYRKSVLVYRYEQRFVEERLDTTVTSAEKEEYYHEHESLFRLEGPVVKGRMVKINRNSPNLSRIRSLYKTLKTDELEVLEELCYSSAITYNNFNNAWVDLYRVAAEMGLSEQQCAEGMARRNWYEVEEMGYVYLLFVYDRVAKGEVAPFEYCENRIEEIIIGRRRDQLLVELEHDLLQEATENEKLKIYRN